MPKFLMAASPEAFLEKAKVPLHKKIEFSKVNAYLLEFYMM